MREINTAVIADSHMVVREGLKAILNAYGNFRVVGEAENGMEAIRYIKEKKPDIAILELSMPKMGGISVIKEVASAVPGTKILVLTIHDEEEYVLEAFESGANGYCLKTSNYTELQFAIDCVLSGKCYTCPKISHKILKGYLEGKERNKTKSSWCDTTQREKEILKLIGEGYTSREIADYLCISIKTVEKHRSNVMCKLGLHNVSEMTAYAIKKGLVVN